MIADYGASTNWPTRLLVDSYVSQDKETAREALKLVNGNYSAEIILLPDVFQQIAKWAEKEP